MVASRRDRKRETVVLRDRLPPLSEGEIRMSVDKVGLSTNNVFYAQMGSAPFLKFFSVYPIRGHEGVVNVPAWGIGTVIASANPDFAVGERFRGFLHMTNLVQMKARRTADGFVACGDNRKKLVKAYNVFVKVDDAASSPFSGDDRKADLAMASAPGVLSGYVLYELMKMKSFSRGNSVVLTSASSKLSLAVAVLLQEERRSGLLKKVIGYTSARHAAFVRSTELFDEVLTYDQALPASDGLRHVMIDVAGDATVYEKNENHVIKAFAVGGTHAHAKASTFTAFGPTGLLKMVASVVGPKRLGEWAEKTLEPKLEMFFAPSVMAELVNRLGKAEFDHRCEASLRRFVDAAIDGGWIQVVRCEDPAAAQAAYQRVFDGDIPPSEAVIVAL